MFSSGRFSAMSKVHIACSCLWLLQVSLSGQMGVMGVKGGRSGLLFTMSGFNGCVCTVGMHD